MGAYSSSTNFFECCNCGIGCTAVCIIRGAIMTTVFPRWFWRWSIRLCWALDRLETAALLRTNGTFQYLTGLPSYPDPQSLRRFLLQAPPDFREQLHRFNDWLLVQFIHRPEHRSRLILDLDSTVVTVFGRQEGAEVGYNPRYRGKRSYDPLLCVEANSTFLWDTELRAGNAGTWDGSPELLASCFLVAAGHPRVARPGRRGVWL